ncbi:MAG: hypothetical protein M3R03_06935 [Pseudomonadota bacterium]|nr:hypothetical protein [Pseudomonadota bacterium]
MNVIFYLTLLVASCGYALWRGDRDARVAAIVCILATALTVLLLTPGSGRYRAVESGAMIVDLATLTAFVTLALTSRRFWPLWVAGLQLTASAAHALKLFDASLVPLAYAAAERFWSYPILLIIAMGAYRAHRRRSLTAPSPR